MKQVQFSCVNTRELLAYSSSDYIVRKQSLNYIERFCYSTREDIFSMLVVLRSMHTERCAEFWSL